MSVLKKTIQHTAIYLLTATVLFASTGVSIHQFYCYCLGKMTASLFKPGNLCGTMVYGEMPDCCKANLAEVVKLCDGKKDCSDCISKYVHLETEYLLFSSEFELDPPSHLPPAKYFAEQKNTIKKSIPIWEYDLPPPLYGKSLLPHIQSFLC